TGASATVQFRDLQPGLSIGTYAGWAWTEQTARGGARISLVRNSWTYTAHAERELASTNDFVLPLEDVGGIGAIIGGMDNFDYVDRGSARFSATRTVGKPTRVLATLEIGGGRDAPELQRLSRGLVHVGEGFRPN